jgi:hypothetical protein
LEEVLKDEVLSLTELPGALQEAEGRGGGEESLFPSPESIPFPKIVKFALPPFVEGVWGDFVIDLKMSGG